MQTSEKFYEKKNMQNLATAPFNKLNELSTNLGLTSQALVDLVKEQNDMFSDDRA